MPKDLRPPVLDDVDRRILDVLATDARATNAAVAARVGIAASTCHARVRALVDRGVIRGFRADVDPAALGRGLEALIAIRLQAGARKGLEAFRDYLLTLPAVEASSSSPATATSCCTSRSPTRTRCATWCPGRSACAPRWPGRARP